MRIKWKNDDDAILTVNRFGLKWTYQTISASEIDVKKSRHNHARKTAIIEQNVDDYADAMERGDVFPMIVVARVDGGRSLIVAGGNHRHQAAIKLGVTEFDVMVVECDQAMFSMLCPALNLYVGQREDRSIRVEQAADAVIRLGITAKQAAEDYRVHVGAVSHCVGEKRTAVAAAKLGLRTDDLAPGYLRVLAPIMNDAALLPVAIDLCRTRIGCDDVRVTLKSARELPTEKDRVGALRVAVENAKKITVSGRISKQPVRSALMRSVSTIAKYISKESTSCSLQLTKDEAKELSAKMMELSIMLGEACRKA